MATPLPVETAVIGPRVARDFGEKHGGIVFGRVLSVSGQKRKLYRVRYTDGDEEDLDEGQLKYAVELATAQNDEGEDSDSGARVSSSRARFLVTGTSFLREYRARMSES